MLDDGFDDPVGLAQSGEPVVEAGGRDEFPGVGSEEWIGLERARALESFSGRLGRDVEQERGHPGICDVRRDLSTHDTGAQNGDRADHGISLPALEPACPLFEEPLRQSETITGSGVV